MELMQLSLPEYEIVKKAFIELSDKRAEIAARAQKELEEKQSLITGAKSHARPPKRPGNRSYRPGNR